MARGQGSPCLCGCGKMSHNPSGYHTNCQNECACGCGTRCRYAYASGHREVVTNECPRCGHRFTPRQPRDHSELCSHCRVKVRTGQVTLTEQSTKVRKQALAPAGKRYCHGCEKYRAVKFFGANKARCRRCARVQAHASMLQKTYNITAEDYARIKESQGGKCALCRRATGASRNLAVDHDHSCCPGRTSCGKCVRGLLCGRCNSILGHARDEVDYFLRAVSYLQDWPASRAGLNRKPTRE